MNQASAMAVVAALIQTYALLWALQATAAAEGGDASAAATVFADARELFAEARYAEAEATLRELAAVQKLSADQSSQYAATLDLLGMVYTAMANYPAAEDCLGESAAITGHAPSKGVAQATTLTHRAKLRYLRADYKAAETFVNDALKLFSQLKLDKTAEYAAALVVLADIERALGSSARAEQTYLRAVDLYTSRSLERSAEYATAENNLGLLYRARGDLVKAERLIRSAMEVREKTLGREHPEYATSLNSFAYVLQSQGKTQDIERLLNEALDIRKKKLGQQHPDYATTTSVLANFYRTQGNYLKAERVAREAVETCGRSLGERHPTYASALNNLGAVYLAQANYVDAEPAFTTAMNIFDAVLTPRHPYSLTVRHNLAELYEAEGDQLRAGRMLDEERAGRQAAKSVDRRSDARWLVAKARLYQKNGKSDEAKKLLRQAADLLVKVPGAAIEQATVLEELANLQRALQEFKAADTLLRQVLKVRLQYLGKEHPDYATALENLGHVYQSTGDYSTAEKLYGQVLELRRKSPGPRHPDFAAALANLADACRAQGKPAAESAARYREALDIVRRHLNQTAAVQSERQQFAMMATARIYLDCYLSLAAGMPEARDDAYAEVLTWKGAISRRQRMIRQMRHALIEQSPEVASLYEQLDAKTRQLAQQSHTAPKKGEEQTHRRALEELSETVERLERELAAKSADFRRDFDGRSVSPDELRQALPENVALVDLIEYVRFSHAKSSKKSTHVERRLLAFVVRREQPTQLVDLGPAKAVEEAVNAWLDLHSLGPSADNDAGTRLRQLLWTPLEKHIAGAETVLVSPDGASAWFPWAALPGRASGEFLIESLAIVMVPVPQMLPDMLSAPPTDSAPPTLLLVGDIDYGAPTGKADAQVATRSAVRDDRDGDRYRWVRLIGFSAEVASVARSFEKAFRDSPEPTELSDAHATEQAVRSEAPKHTYLHFATHGFFAPPKIAAAGQSRAAAESLPGGRAALNGIAGFSPGLLSAIVLAGANRPEELQQDDGMLTASEVEQLDLSSVRLATLSACQTGIGRTAGGEGLLGLQRAFQVAGADSVVASLWRVSDRQTQLLMTSFYDNLWKQKLSRAEALRQAQIEMLKHGASRGMTFSAKHPLGKDQRLPPYDWAAFALSGDWR